LAAIRRLVLALMPSAVLAGCVAFSYPLPRECPEDCNFVEAPEGTWVKDGECRRLLLGWTECEPVELPSCSGGAPAREPVYGHEKECPQ